MRDYKNSDYALNKHRDDSIVYRFVNEISMVTMTDYLALNPEKTEQDFHMLKVLSDAIFREQDRAECRQTKKNVPLHRMDEDNSAFAVASAEEECFNKLNQQTAISAFNKLLENGELTRKQKRRFIMFFYEGMSLRAIAREENVYYRAVAQSINTSVGKLKKYFNFFVF